jgi:hypothetical protein
MLSVFRNMLLRTDAPSGEIKDEEDQGENYDEKEDQGENYDEIGSGSGGDEEDGTLSRGSSLANLEEDSTLGSEKREYVTGRQYSNFIRAFIPCRYGGDMEAHIVR